MMHRFTLYAVAVLVLLPLSSEASVLISEVAWMGSESNANAEWIELYNDGEAVDLSGWVLSAEDGQPVIPLSGVLPANSHALLERSSDDTVPSVDAYLVYTGSLANSGEYLRLRDATGVIVDEVNGANDWSVGGSNETKATLQRSGVPPTGTWITAAPNPSGVPAVDDPVEQDEEVVEAPQTKKVFSGGTVVYGKQSSEADDVRIEPGIILAIGESRTVTTGVAHAFEARTYRESGKEVVQKNVSWNFGDGSTGVGKVVKHTFQHTGEYVVTARVCRTGLLEEVCDDDRITVHATSPTLEIVAVTGEYIEVKNTSTTEVDVSGFVLGKDASYFRIPDGTILLPETSVKFPRTVTGIRTKQGSNVVAYHPSGALATQYRTPPAVYASTPVARRAASPAPVVRAQQDTVQVQKKAQAALASIPLPEFAKVAEAFDAGSGSNESGSNTVWLWLLGALAAIGVVVVSSILIRTEKEEFIEGLEIESDE